MNPEPPSAPGVPATPDQPYTPSYPSAYPSARYAWAAEPEPPPERPINRPARWAIVVLEVVAAAALIALALWAWDRVAVPYRLPDYQNPAVPDSVTRVSGPWAAAAVGAGLLAAIALLDAVREAVLAVRPPAAPDRGEPAGR